MIARLRLVFVGVALLVTTLGLLVPQALAMALGWKLANRLPMVWQRVAARIVGIRVRLAGTPSREHPLLIVSNHVSWADITVLGSVLPLSFIAKAEVRRWPVFGWLAVLQRTVFVAREARGRTGEQADAIATRLSAGDVMVLFAEGTTSDGNEVLPFKTALFGAAQASLRMSAFETVLVQPVAIAYTHAHGFPLGRSGRPLAAWPGNVALGPHLVRFVEEGAVDAIVAFGEPIRFGPTSDRKIVAKQCEDAVRRLLAQALMGKLETRPRRGHLRDGGGRNKTV
ncbi:lysophospholipid acyltransferase family protein [Fulvimarina sp. 2208YS6-2-32]|uniref:Lysophospholipid acyltransferase family protein n=1 Tax=Fulvimarina uroteuthidis TaxID=3098149 RepID=A0ABU5HXI6_9HYPH|nr:lysophospholipid acyltransferase family protein [Fulvimarina sp. 2208YS6-2-32]MDY8107850.1 lysophospholipid acyltransferase family protein [Fulvimarina sp. 2208YS6-2-32]